MFTDFLMDLSEINLPFKYREFKDDQTPTHNFN